MKATKISIIIAAAVVSLSLAAGAWAAPKKVSKQQPKAKKETVQAGEMSQADVMALIKATYPNFTVNELRKIPVAGLWEIVAGSNIIYFVPQSKSLIFGEIVQPGGLNITQARRDELATKTIRQLDLSLAVRIGSGPNTVIIFTDPECSYCKKVSAYLRENEKLVTQFVFLMPVRSTVSAAKAAYVLTAKDKAKAYNDMDLGKADVDWKTYKIDAGANQQIQKHISMSQKLGIRGTPMLWINGTAVNGANMPMIEKLIKEKK